MMLKRILFENLGMKLMALVMAICLWFYSVKQNSRELTKIPLPLEITVPQGTILLQPKSPILHVDVRGPQVIMDRISSMIGSGRFKGKYVINTPIDDLQDTRTEKIDPERILLPNDAMDAELTGFIPQEMKITIAKSITKRMTIEIPKYGTLPPGYRISYEFRFPTSVVVSGPKHLLEKVSTIKTEPFDLSAVPAREGEIADYLSLVPEVEVQIGKRTKTAKVTLREGERKIRFEMGIAQVLEERSFKDVGIKILRPVDYPYDVRLTDGDRINLKVKGPKSELETLNAIVKEKHSAIKAFVDVSELKPTIGADSALGGSKTDNPPHRLNLLCHFPPEFPDLRLVENTEKIKVDIIQRKDVEIKQSAEARK